MEPTPAPSKFSLPVVIGGAVVILIIAGFLFMGRGDGGMMAGDSAGKKSVVKDMIEKKSLKGLLSMGGSQKCTFEQSSDISKSSGTFYVSGTKSRGDFESTVLSGPGAGTVMKNHMVSDGEALYTWDDTTGQGMKMSMANMPTGETGMTDTARVQGTAAEFNQEYDYQCESWNGDSSMFELPANINFMSMDDMMKGIMPKAGAGVTGKVVTPAPQGMDMNAIMAAQCGSCDQAGDQRDACRAALGCK